MKRIYPILSLLVLLGISVPAAAQITIEVDETQNTPPTTILATQVKNSRVDANSYFS